MMFAARFGDEATLFRLAVQLDRERRGKTGAIGLRLKKPQATGI